MQETYNLYFTPAIEGQFAYGNYNNYVESYLETGAINFGRGVALDGERKCKLVSADTDSVIGIALATSSKQKPTLDGQTQYDEKDAVNVLRKGSIWVYVQDPDGVTAGDDVFVYFSGTNQGQFANDAQTSTAVQIPGAKFKTDAVQGALAVVELNLPQS
jgi:hypothetical protein